LGTLETIRNNAARLILGASRSSPIPEVPAESDVIPLHVQRQKSLLNYIARITNNPSIQNYTTFNSIQENC
ncbi:hypothetical protein HHI36_016982, partial [Cryptolaemus montrouzieri]